ncbi:MAG: ATP-binding cassette domain-containing protein, partial [Muribaculaceae bacterium]|nr:ATP-binding cassette domain-containing protein [Muribaculaceae bacterium]
MDIIRANNITKKYTGHTALDNVSVSIPEGSIYGLLGPNGAGKTTLIRIINHITAPDSGELWFGDHLLTANDVTNIGYLPEERGLYKKMRVGDQALFFAKLKGLKTREATIELKKWFERFGIMDWWNKKVEELSKGMAQKIQFIVTVLHRPKLLIFDEPFSGFDPINAELLKQEILRLRDEGATVIFSTHNMESVEALCDNFTLINRSHNILSGNVAEIRRNMGKDNYRLSFIGDPAALLTSLADTVAATRIHEPQDTPDGLPINAEFT